jgi:hypothetical protein
MLRIIMLNCCYADCYYAECRSTWWATVQLYKYDAHYIVFVSPKSTYGALWLIAGMAGAYLNKLLRVLLILQILDEGGRVTNGAMV